MKPLCVITCHFNPQGYERPAANFGRFLATVAPYVDLRTIELRFDDDDYFWQYPAHRSNFDGMSVNASRERSLLWQKEALLNKLINVVVNDYDAIAWVDGDVLFTNEDWPKLAMRELEHNLVCQLFSSAYRLDRDGEIDQASGCKSFGWWWSTRNEKWKDLCVSHPGYAWAARSEFLREHKLYDKMITGCGDSAMLRGFTGDDSYYFKEDVGDRVSTGLDSWSKSVAQDVQGQVGFVLGSVVHMWHGDIENRKNRERREFMRELDPRIDLRYAPSGVLEWTDFALKNKQRMVKGVASYFEIRKEDG